MKIKSKMLDNLHNNKLSYFQIMSSLQGRVHWKYWEHSYELKKATNCQLQPYSHIWYYYLLMILLHIQSLLSSHLVPSRNSANTLTPYYMYSSSSSSHSSYLLYIYPFHGFHDSILSRWDRIIDIRQLLCEIRWMDFDLTDVRLTIWHWIRKEYV